MNGTVEDVAFSADGCHMYSTGGTINVSYFPCLEYRPLLGPTVLFDSNSHNHGQSGGAMVSACL